MNQPRRTSAPSAEATRRRCVCGRPQRLYLRRLRSDIVVDVCYANLRRVNVALRDGHGSLRQPSGRRFRTANELRDMRNASPDVALLIQATLLAFCTTCAGRFEDHLTGRSTVVFDQPIGAPENPSAVMRDGFLRCGARPTKLSSFPDPNCVSPGARLRGPGVTNHA